MANALQYGLQIALQALLAPVVLSVAGQETLGSYATLLQAMGYLAIVDLGFSFTLNRYLANASGLDDQGDRFSSVLGTGRSFLVVVGVVYFFAAGGLSFIIGQLLKLSPTLESQARVAVWLLAAWGLVRFPLSVYGDTLMAIQDLAFRHLLSAVSISLRLVGSLGLVYLGFGLIGMVLGNILGEITDFSISWLRFSRLKPDCRPEWKLKDSPLFREMLNFGLQGLLITLAGRLIFFSDKLVIGYLMGAAQVSIYYTTQIPAMLCYTFFWKLADNAAPAINELFARQNFERLKIVYLRLIRYTFLMAIPFAVGFMELNSHLVRMWVGSAQYAGPGVTFGIVAFGVALGISHVSYVFIIASGKIRNYTMINTAEGVIGVGLALLLGKIFGLEGVALSAFLAHLLNLAYSQFRAQKELGVSVGELMRYSLVPPLCIGLFSGMVLLFMLHLITLSSWLNLISIVGVFMASHAVACFFFGLASSERNMIVEWFYTISIKISHGK